MKKARVDFVKKEYLTCYHPVLNFGSGGQTDLDGSTLVDGIWAIKKILGTKDELRRLFFKSQLEKFR